MWVMILTAILVAIFSVIQIILLVSTIRMYERMSTLKAVDLRLYKIEDTIATILDNMNDFYDNGDGASFFYSQDGKYTANSLEELFKKMADGGDLNISDEDKNKLIEFFKSDPETDEPWLDEDDNSNEDWTDE